MKFQSLNRHELICTENNKKSWKHSRDIIALFSCCFFPNDGYFNIKKSRRYWEFFWKYCSCLQFYAAGSIKSNYSSFSTEYSSQTCPETALMGAERGNKLAELQTVKSKTMLHRSEWNCRVSWKLYFVHSFQLKVLKHWLWAPFFVKQVFHFLKQTRKESIQLQSLLSHGRNTKIKEKLWKKTQSEKVGHIRQAQHCTSETFLVENEAEWNKKSGGHMRPQRAAWWNQGDKFIDAVQDILFRFFFWIWTLSLGNCGIIIIIIITRIQRAYTSAKAEQSPFFCSLYFILPKNCIWEIVPLWEMGVLQYWPTFFWPLAFTYQGENQ